jgi:hypothetical protein
MVEYVLDPMSNEQTVVYQHILNGHNAIVDACAGSGKSTTILSIATHIPDRFFIQLTYNSMLCNEIQTKVDLLRLQNLKIYTFHSLAVRYYSSDAHTDTAIRRILRNKKPPRSEIPKMNVLVIDEAQDMTFLYFKLVVKFCRDYGEPIQLLVLGDFMQGLYEFKGADTRFLTCANNIWNDFELLSSRTFHNCSLKMSYRITQPMADFVNKVMLGEERLLACRDGEPVVYLRRSSRDAEKYVIYKINQLLMAGAKPSDFFILGGSVKGQNSAIRRMENILVENNIPCHVPMFENEKIDERVIEGKIVFSTFHSVKGRQRKYVFVMGFDQSYFTFFARNLPHTICPNTLYVACTRATHGLFLIERNEPKRFDRPLKFLKCNHSILKEYPFVDFKGIPQTVFYQKEEDGLSGNLRERNGRKLPTHMITPTELIKFIPESVIEEILPTLENIFIKINVQENATVIDIPGIIKTKRSFYEDVSDLNGIAIPIMYFDILNTRDYINASPTGKDTIKEGGILLKEIIESSMLEVKENDHSFLKKIIGSLPTTCLSIDDYLWFSNVFVAAKEKLYFKLNQIQMGEYNWIEENQLNQCFERMHTSFANECFDSEGKFSGCIERTLLHSSDETIHKKIDDLLCEYFPNELFRFTGRVDLVTDYCVWELKCTTDITNDHFLQVVIYAWLWRMVIENIAELENIRDFRIFNIKTGDMYRLEATTSELTFIMISLLKGKYGEREVRIDNDFISDCKQYFLE